MRNRILLRLYIPVLLICSCILFFIEHADAFNDPAETDLNNLSAVSHMLSNSSNTILIYRNSVSITEKEFPQLVGELQKKLTIPVDLHVLSDSPHLVYGADHILEQKVKLSLRIAQLDDSSAYIVTRLEYDNDIDTVNRRRWMNDVERMTQVADIRGKGTWNLMMQGYLSPSNQNDHIDRTLSAISKQINGEQLGSYTDANTISFSWHSPHFSKQNKNGSQPMNVQIALHRDTESRQWRWTIGTPVITIEY